MERQAEYDQYALTYQNEKRKEMVRKDREMAEYEIKLVQATAKLQVDKSASNDSDHIHIEL